MPEVDIVPLTAPQLPALQAFFDSLPEGDVTFIKEDVRDPAVARGWVEHPGDTERWVAVDGGELVGYVSLGRLPGWSSHVGELRVVVAPSVRGKGVGRALTAHALRHALDAGLQKVVIEVVAEQEGAVRMFGDLGFRGEAVLVRHIRDRDGHLRDLLVLAHDANEEWSAMASLGIEGDLLGGP